MPIDYKNLTPDKKRKLQKLARVVDGGNIGILEHLFEIEDLISEVRKSVPDLQSFLESVRGKDGATPKKGVDYFTKSEIAGFKEEITPVKGKDYFDGQKGDTPIKGKDYYTKKDKEEIIIEASKRATPKKGKDYLTPDEIRSIKKEITPVKGKDYFDGEKGDDGNIKQIAPQEVRNLLELLQDDERLDAKAIKGLDEHIGLKINDVKSGFQFVGSPGSGGRVVRYYDLSPLLDSSTTTFQLPANWRIVAVMSSSAPFILRPTTDYTSTDVSITFTSQIDPTVTLATGQTVTILYSEP